MRTVLLAAAVATALAGVVGVIRQRREGPLPRAAEVTPPPDGEGRLSAALAVWVPSRPRSRAGRFLAALNAAPATAVGAVVGASTGGRWRRDAAHGCWVVEGGTRGAAYGQSWLGFGANGIGQVVVSRHPVTSAALLAHEVVHVRQHERLGPLLVPAYLWLLARRGYRHHPMERAARLGAARSVSGTALP